MKKIIALTLFTFCMNFLVFSQEKETRSFEAFTGVSVGEAVELIVTQGDKNEAVIEVDRIDLDDVTTSVKNSILQIKRTHMNNQRGQVTVYLTYKEELTAISVSSAAFLVSESKIKTESLEIEVSSAGSAELDVDVSKLIVKLSSAAQLDIIGRASNVDLEVDSAGSFEGYDLQCKDIFANISSGGSARVNVSRRLEADANSGGSVYYKGNPGKVLVDTNSSGRVSRR